MNFKIIKTEKEYDKALERLDKIFDAAPNSEEGQEAELLALLIENYEDEHFLYINKILLTNNNGNINNR